LGPWVRRSRMLLDAAPNGADRVCVAVAIKISLLRSCSSASASGHSIRHLSLFIEQLNVGIAGSIDIEPETFFALAIFQPDPG
jgi:hypothetical protein